MNTTGAIPSISEHTHRQASLAFQEYQFVADDTAKITDRRQTVNTLFVSINAIFLTGVGYLIFQYARSYRDSSLLVFFTLGFMVIAIITTIINRSWLRLSEQSRRLINLRIRYLAKLELFMRNTGFFPNVEVALKGTDAYKDKEFEEPPLAMKSTVSTHLDAAEVTEFAKRAAARAARTDDNASVKDDDTPAPQRWMSVRGTYTLEDVLYNNPNPKFKVFSFSKAEQRVVAAFTSAYWIAFAAAALGLIALFVTYYTGFHFTLGPLHF